MSNHRRAAKRVGIIGNENTEYGGQNKWTAVWAAHQSIGKIPECLLLVRLYGRVRTEFDTHGGEIRVR